MAKNKESPPAFDDQKKKIFEACPHAVQEAIKDKKVHPRLAAMVVGVARVAEACKLRGWV